MTYSVTVDTSQIDALADRERQSLAKTVELIADVLMGELAKESGGASTRVADGWQKERQGADGMLVNNAEFFAGWLARGTRGHGPTSAPRMTFAIDGGVVSTTYVAGIRADPFDERAVRTTESDASDLIAQLVEAAA